ncbi:MAG: CapA family protein [Candidatus Hydrogenedentes bacterium]|nr:CapA family protein [Candidatus Hydrogenedentota bacterium]
MKLVLVGDVMLGRLVNETLEFRGPAAPWGNTLGLFHAADWRVCNLECAISDRGAPWVQTPRVFHFRSDAKNVAVLQAAGINAVSLANNHALDYGNMALEDTVALLKEAGILCAGAGANATAARQPVFASVAGTTIGLVGFTANEPGWEATTDQAGVFYAPTKLSAPQTRLLLNTVAVAKQHAQLLIVAAHWGPNWGRRPPQEHAELGHALIEAGADIVFGHSAHIFRGVEIYRGRPILYSTGDFIDDYAVDPVERNDQSFLFRVDCDATGIHGIDLFPTIIDDFAAHRARPPERDEIVQRMRARCAQLGATAHWADDVFLRIEIDGASR